MGQSYYDFMMKQPGIASSLVAGVAADRESQNKERLQQAAAALKKRLLEEVSKKAELDRVQNLSNSLSLAPGQMAAAGEAAAKVATANDARYQSEGGYAGDVSRFEAARNNADALTAAIPTGQETQEGWKALGKSEEARAVAANLGRSLATSVKPLAKRKELTQEEFDAQVNRTYHRPEDVDILEQNRNAYVMDGNAYTSYDEAKAVRTEQQRQAALEKSVRQNSAKFDISGLEKEGQAAIAKLEAEKANLPQELLKEGVNIKDLSPEALASMQGTLQKRIDDAKASYQADYEAAKKTGAGPGVADQFAKRKAEIDKLISLRDATSGMAGYYEKKKQFHQSVDQDAASLLTEMLVNNPMAERPDPREEDRLREKALEARLPEIMQLQSVDPEGTKTLLEQLKRESSQGDAGLNAMAKKEAQTQQMHAQLLSRYKSLSENADAQRQKLGIELAKLALAKKKADDKAASDKDRKDYWDALIRSRRELGLLHELHADMRSNEAARSNIVGRAAASNMFYTDQGKDATSTFLSQFVDPATADLVQSTDASFREFMPLGQAKRGPAKSLKTTEKQKMVGTETNLETQDLPDPKMLPPLPGQGKVGAVKKEKLSAKIPSPPSGWTSPKKLPDGSWIAKNPKTNKFERY